MQPQRAPGVTPPPDLPSMPDESATLSTYLRRFSLWCHGNFNNTLNRKSATAAILMMSTTGQSVWSVTIDDAGNLTTARMTPGGAL